MPTPGTLVYVQLENGAAATAHIPTLDAPVSVSPPLDPATDPAVAWSDNPALCLADFLSSQSYGARREVDWQSVGVAADYCDELIGTPPEKRNLISLVLSDKRKVRDWADVMRAYVPCFLPEDGNVVKLVPDMPRVPDHVFISTVIDADPPPKLKKRGVRDTPTVVEIGYTKTDASPWATGYAEAATGATIRSKARIELPGITRYSQARRFAIERLNHYTLEDLEIDFKVFEDGLKVSVGDIVTVTDDIGLGSDKFGAGGKRFRVLAAKDQGNGSWTIHAREYDPAAYSEVVELEPSTPDLNLPDPRNVPAPTSLQLAEEIYLEKQIADPQSLARGLIYQTRLVASWAASAYPYPHTYRVLFEAGGEIVHEVTTPGTSCASPTVQQGVVYTVRVIARSGLGHESSALESTIEARGKLLPPGSVPAITSAFEIGGEVLLAWDAAADVDVIRYEWRYSDADPFVWDTATMIDRVDGLRARFRGLPVGEWTFGVKAIDSVGNYSATPTTVVVTITSDADAILQEREFGAATLTNMIQVRDLEGEWRSRWVTDVASDAWSSVMPNPLSSGSNPVASYHASATSKFEGTTWDLGIAVSGDWTLTLDATALTGAYTAGIESKILVGDSWTLHSGTSFAGEARYVRPVVQALTTATLQINRPPIIGLAAITRSESGGPVTSAASGATTITLAGKYAKASRITVTPRGTAARMPTVDNVQLSLVSANTFDVYLFDAAGAQVSSNFDWSFEGF